MQEEKARQLFDALAAIPAPKTPESRDSDPVRPMFDVQLHAGTQKTGTVLAKARRTWTVIVTKSADPRGTNWRSLFAAITEVDENFDGLTQIAVVTDSIVLT